MNTGHCSSFTLSFFFPLFHHERSGEAGMIPGSGMHYDDSAKSVEGELPPAISKL